MPQSLATEFALSSQHVSRVTAALRRGWEGVTQSTIYFLDDAKHIYLTRKGHKLLNLPESPTLFVTVKALPKNALIEKQVMLHTGRREIEDDEGEVEDQIADPVLCASETEGNGFKIYHETLKFQDGPFLCGIVFGRGIDESHIQSHLLITPPSEVVLSARVFYQPKALPLITAITSHCKFPVVLVPCRAISSINDDGWDYALHIMGIDKTKT